MQSSIRGILRISLLIMWLTLWAPILLACRAVGGNSYIKARCWMYKVGLQIVRIDTVIRGQMCVKPPVLYVSNHVSYLDIMVLGSLLPASFISKHEVKSWPVFGWVASLTSTVFIERSASRTTEGLKRVKEHLKSGKSLILFPEGTTTNGNHVKHFKSSFFQVVEQEIEGVSLSVQPVSIAYTHINGLPMGVKWRTHFAWTGNTSLLPHVWEVLKHGGAQVEVGMHEPISSEPRDRKQISRNCQQIISRSLSQSLRGNSTAPVANLVHFPTPAEREKRRSA